MRLKIFVLLFIFLIEGVCVAQTSGQSLSEQSSKSLNTRLDAQVDNYLKQQMRKYRIPGLSVAVVKNSRVVKLKGYGVANLEFDVPADTKTVYQLFSVSKIFAGVAVMKLVEEGRLTLDTPVTDIIATLPREWKAIHIRHLLTHTSGLPEMSANPRFACLPEDKKKRITPEEEIALLSELPLKFQPGAKWSYHLSGYQLLGFIVQRVTKKSYNAFLEERIFSPLGMGSTKFGGTEAGVIKRRSPTSYSRETGQLTGWIYPFTPRDYPAAGLNSSAEDLAKFLIALDSDQILSGEHREEMWTPVELNNGTEKPYGLGWTVDEHKGRKVVGHEGGGAIWVATSRMISFPWWCYATSMAPGQTRFNMALRIFTWDCSSLASSAKIATQLPYRQSRNDHEISRTKLLRVDSCRFADRFLRHRLRSWFCVKCYNAATDVMDWKSLPTINASRVSLRWITEDDVDALYRIFSNTEVMRYWSTPPLTDRNEAVTLLHEIHDDFRSQSFLKWGIARRH